MTVVQSACLLHVGTGLISNQPVELVVFLLIGLLGGAHCLGMCGPLVTAYTTRMAESRHGRDRFGVSWFEVRQHSLFNIGRTLSYAAIGGLFGLVGSALYGVSSVALAANTEIRIVSGLLVGGFIMVNGGAYLVGRQRLLGHIGGGAFGRVYGTLASRIEGWVNSPKIIGLGLVHGLLPCPLIYPAFLYAFARGSPLGGVLALTALGIGTIPAMFLYGTVLGSLDPTSRGRLHRALGVAFVVLGWMAIAHSVEFLGVQLPHFEPPTYQPLTP